MQTMAGPGLNESRLFIQTTLPSIKLMYGTSNQAERIIMPPVLSIPSFHVSL